MKNYKFISIILVLVFFVGLNNVGKADTFYQKYQDSGCSDGGSFAMPCTFAASPSDWNPVAICAGNGGITPASCNSAGGGLIWYDNSLILSHYVTLNTDKTSYKVGEAVIPTLSATDLNVLCQSKWEKTIPIGDITGLNMKAWTTTGIFQGAYTFTSPTWVNSFSISTTGPTILYTDYNRSPLTYINDCNDSTNINITGTLISTTFNVNGVTLKIK